jgi:hypothetical protein
MPAARTPAQVEAARRNGASSRGPATPEGKARSSMNALKHGLAAADHLLLEGEDRTAYEELVANLIDEIEPDSELEGQLVRRLASALWRQSRADRLESKLFAWTDTPKVFHAGKYLPVDAEANFDLARFAAVQRYQPSSAARSPAACASCACSGRNPSGRHQNRRTNPSRRQSPPPRPNERIVRTNPSRPGRRRPAPRFACRTAPAPSPPAAPRPPVPPPTTRGGRPPAGRRHPARRGSACRTPPPSPPP